jgi:MFS family permease
VELLGAGAAASKRRHEIWIALAAYITTTAVNLQVPLYPKYAEAADHGIGTLTLVFACYVVGLLPILILLGGISDRIGRRIPILAGLACAFVATALVLMNPTLATLAVARIVQGIGVGLGVAAGTAFLAELLEGAHAPQRAAAYITVATSLGFGSGALLTSICVAIQDLNHHPDGAPFSYYLLLPVILVLALAVARVPERRARRPGVWVRPPHFQLETLPQCFAIFLAWAITGMVIAVVPTELARHDMTAWTGVALFCVNGTGVLFQPIARRMEPERALSLGLFLAPLGYVMLALGAWLGSVGLLLTGAAVAGSACYGFTYLGGLASVSAAAHDERARAASGYFLFAYLGFSVPVILSGFVSDHLGILPALSLFGMIAIIWNAGIAYAMALVRVRA